MKRQNMHFLSICALFICQLNGSARAELAEHQNTNCSFCSLHDDVKVHIARYLGSQNNGVLQRTNSENEAIVMTARALDRPSQLSQIDNEYRQLIDATDITAEQIMDSFVWSGMMMDQRRTRFVC